LYWEKSKPKTVCKDKRDFATFCSEKELKYMGEGNRLAYAEDVGDHEQIKKAYHMLYSGLAGFAAALLFLVTRYLGMMAEAPQGKARELLPRDSKKLRSLADIDDIGDESLDDFPIHFTTSSGHITGV
jgi:hypothetical protein